MAQLVRLLWLTATICGLLRTTDGYATGAPNSVCGTMTPGHTGTKPQASLTPYEIDVSQSSVQAGGKMNITVKSKTGVPFKGFLLEARDVSLPKATLGTFIVSDDTVSKLVNCGGAFNSGVTHKSSNDKISVTVEWVAPSNFAGQVTFWATFVQNYDTYWTNVTSMAVSVTGGQPEDPTSMISCGPGTSCFGFPEGCVATGTCNILVSYEIQRSGGVMFQLEGKSNGYVAFGLSDDNVMGNDSVVECVRDGEDVKTSMSWNLGKPGRRGNRRLSNPLLGLSNTKGTAQDGWISCTFIRDAITIVEGETFNLNEKEYYLMLASGELEQDGSLDYHLTKKIVSKKAVSLRSVLPVQDITTSSPIDARYGHCGHTMSCFGYPSGCVAGKTCEALISYGLQNGKYVFDLIGKSDGYVAFGLSTDPMMGNDSVVDCVKERGQVKTYMSWNWANSTRKGNRRLSDPQLGLSESSGSLEDGWIRCSFVRQPQTIVEQHQFDLVNDDYFLMLALGNISDDGSLDYHFERKIVGESAVSLKTVQPVTEVTTKSPDTPDDPIYEGCAVTKACFGYPSECSVTKSCEGVVTYTLVDGNYHFELKGRSDGYVAFGLSFDNQMGDDSVVECIKEGETVQTYMSWNLPSKDNERLDTPLLGLSDTSGSYSDGMIHCKFIRAKNTTVMGQIFDLDSDFYLMVALGNLQSGGKLAYHFGRKLVSASGTKLSSVATLAGKSTLLRKLHGAFMITAWIGAASCGILLARYFKQTWTRRQICGKDTWFAWHRIIMTTAWGLTISAFVLIFVELQGWTKIPLSTNPHAVLGCITTGLAFIQPFMAFFRPHPGTTNRPLFNWAHWLVGNLAQIIGIVTIFLAVRLPDQLLPEFSYWILVAFVGYHCLMHLIFSIHQCQSDRSGVHVISPPPNSKNSAQSRVDAPGSTFRKLMLAFYLLVNWIITLLLVLLVVFSPIENHIKSLGS